ncbi:MAG: ABC transporter ATP-binding protein [Cyanobacteria bacterium P01_H01_bin.15]
MAAISSHPSKARKSDSDWRLLLRLLPYARRNQRLIGIALIVLIPISIAGAIQPLIVGQAISLLRGESVWPFLRGVPLERGLNALIGLLLGTILLRLVLVSIQGFWVQRVGQEMTAAIRDDLFRHVAALPVSFFDRTPVGKLVTRLTSDVEALGDVFATGAVGIVRDIFYILAIAIAIFWVNGQLALLLIGLLIPTACLINFFQRQYRVANYEAREELSRLNSTLQENIAGISVVQLFRREGYNAGLFRNINDRYRQQVDKTIFHDSAVSATLEWVAFIAIALILGVGGSFALQDRITLGALSAFILYAQRLFGPLREFADKFTILQSGFTAVERISELLDEPIAIQDPQHGQQQTVITGKQTGEIRFEHVWFAYKHDEYVLKDLDFVIKPGEKVALVGPTGAGKSSVIRLLCRLYEPSRGRILVDGIDIRNLPQQELRRHVGVILQDCFLFAGDVTRNISLGDEYPLSAIQRAAQATNVDTFIQELPQGYATELRERGTNLSGGQKQLLAFARAAVRNPKILVLDEATANLDVVTEALIQGALEQLLVERTAIIIAHRLSTIRNVDRILVLKSGALLETGTHEQLLAQDGLYASLYKLQMLGTGAHD